MFFAVFKHVIGKGVENALATLDADILDLQVLQLLDREIITDGKPNNVQGADQKNAQGQGAKEVALHVGSECSLLPDLVQPEIPAAPGEAENTWVKST